MIHIIRTVVCVNIYLLVINTPSALAKSVQGPAEDAVLDFKGLALKYGYKSQEHNVITEDGYILKLHRIPGNKTRPVLLMHGFLDTSDTFILRGRKSLSAVLSDAGYDVWIGNCRGNKYSRRHIKLNPDADKEFWNFSFHEMAVIDLRLFIDFILAENNAIKISLIGHSQGNTLFYILGSMLPEYNDRIGVAIALGPEAYFMAENFEAPLDILFSTGPVINELLLALDGEEIFSDRSLIVQFMDNVCKRREMGYMICAEGLFSMLGGEDVEEIEPDFFQVILGHYPTSTSRKVAEHYFQIAQRKEFAAFDYGPKKNMEIYNSEIPPSYDLKKVTMNVALVAGKNDKLAPLRNVDLLRENLANVVSYHVMERPQFNHIDHIWGKHMYKYLFPHLLRLLEKYS